MFGIIALGDDFMGKIIFHVDVNSAYLSWEASYRLSQGEAVDLRTIPSIVGGDPKTRKGIVLAKSIPAKKYKIMTGEPVGMAFEKCPFLVTVKPRYHLYMRASLALKEVILKYTPSIQQFSIDEFFLDMTGYTKDPVSTAYELKNRIRDELGFTVNIGVSNNKLLAKMASDFKKPDNVHTLFPYEIETKMWPLPIGDLFMVGPKTKEKLLKMGIRTIGELALTEKEFIRDRLKSHGLLIWEYANGIESSVIRSDDPLGMKGIGNSSTLRRNIDTREDAFMYLLALTEMVCMRLRNAGKLAGVVAVSIKSTEFKRYSHQSTLVSATDSTNVIYREIKRLFDESWQREPIRHLGVRVTRLSENTYYQYSLLDDKNIDNMRKADQAIDELRLRYGKNSVTRGVFLGTGIKPVIGGVEEENYKLMTSLL